MFGILSSSALRTQAGDLVAAFVAACPVAKLGGGGAALEKRVAQALDELCAATAAYARAQRLGILGRARLAKALQEELRRRDYPADVVSRVTGAVTVNALVTPGRDAAGR